MFSPYSFREIKALGRAAIVFLNCSRCIVLTLQELLIKTLNMWPYQQPLYSLSILQFLSKNLHVLDE